MKIAALLKEIFSAEAACFIWLQGVLSLAMGLQ